MQNTAHGITLTDDGSFLFVSLKKRDNSWRIITKKKWDSSNTFKNGLLLNRGVVAAVPCSFKNANTKINNEQDLIYSQDNGLLAPYAHTPSVSPFSNYLAANCIAAVPDDSFLATLPLAFSNKDLHSFVSIFQTATEYKIGIIINSALTAVFTMSPVSPEAIISHLARIERYCSIMTPETPMPRHVYTFNFKSDGINQSHFQCNDLTIPPEIVSNKETAVAIGAALANVTCKIPTLSFDATRSSFRHIRAIGYAISMAFLGSVIACSLFFGIFSAYSATALSKYKSKYQTIVQQNPDIKKLLDENESFAKDLLSLSSVFANRTGWADFLQLLGVIRPSGLYFEMLGSESLNKTNGTVRIALSGYASNESLITDFISGLQKSNIISQVSLSSMERDKAQNVVTYKVICLLKCTALSKTK